MEKNLAEVITVIHTVRGAIDIALERAKREAIAAGCKPSEMTRLSSQMEEEGLAKDIRIGKYLEAAEQAKKGASKKW